MITYSKISDFTVKMFHNQNTPPNLSLCFQLPLLSSRAVQLGSLYVRGLSHLLGANCASGCPLPSAALMPWHSFDGRLFHSKYLLAHSGTEKIELLDHNVSGDMTTKGEFMSKSKTFERKTWPLNFFWLVCLSFQLVCLWFCLILKFKKKKTNILDTVCLCVILSLCLSPSRPACLCSSS